jgi:hypothetical protein
VEAEVLDSLSRRQVYAIVDQYKGSKFQPHGIERWGQTEASMRTWSRKIRAGIQGSAAPASKPTAKGTRESAPSASEKKAGEGSKIGAFFREHRSE